MKVWVNDHIEEVEDVKSQEECLELSEPTQQDKIEAQVMYTALMTDTLLEEQYV